MARDISAAAAPVEDRGVSAMTPHELHERCRRRTIARVAVTTAEIEIGDAALEKARRDRNDRMRVPENDAAVLATHARDLALEAAMIRSPHGSQPPRDLGVARVAAAVERLAREGVDGAEP